MNVDDAIKISTLSVLCVFGLLKFLLTVIPARIELPIAFTQAKPNQGECQTVVTRDTMSKKLVFDLLYGIPVLIVTREHQIVGDVFSDFFGVIATDTQALRLFI